MPSPNAGFKVVCENALARDVVSVKAFNSNDSLQLGYAFSLVEKNKVGHCSAFYFVRTIDFNDSHGEM